MSEYLISVLVISAVAGMCSRLTYGSGKLCRLSFAVVTLYVIVSPIASLVERLDAEKLFSDIVISDELSEGEYAEVAREAVESGVADAVSNKFSIDRECVRVALIDFDFSSMRAGEIRVFLSLSAAHTELPAVEQYVEELNIGECRAEYEIR